MAAKLRLLLRKYLTRKTGMRVLRVTVVGLLVYAVLGFGILPGIARRVAEREQENVAGSPGQGAR